MLKEKTVLISFSIEDLQTMIIDCFNSCLKYNPIKPTDSPETGDQLLTLKDAAKFINLSPNTVYGLVHNSLIPVSKRGKKLYFSKQELLAWIQSGRKKTIEEIEAEAENFITSKKKRG